RLDILKRCKSLAGGTAHRHDAVLIGPAAFGEQVLPPEFLDRSLICVQLQVLVLIRKTCKRRQRDLVIAGIDVDLMNGKTKTAVEVAIEGPGDDSNIIVGKSDCGHRTVLVLGGGK